MKLQKILWIVALILIIIIVSTSQKEKKGFLADGTYCNCYMILLKDDQMSVVVDGREWSLYCPTGETEEKTDKIVDIVVERNQIKKITWKEGQTKDKIEAVSAEEKWLRMKENGKMEMSEQLKIYIKDEEGIRIMSNAASLLNWDEVLLYIHGGKVEAIVVSGKQNQQVIKVLLHGSQDQIYHKEVRLTASANYEITSPKGTKKYEAGQEFQLSEIQSLESKTQAPEETGTYHITCPEGKIRMLSFAHTSGYPEYRGQIIIETTKQGYLIRNELSVEDYLYSVVSSEMPSSYPKEALKAQAVCARTYALYQMQQAYYSAYGAHVDDTVNSQVYNNVAETEASIKAVDETKGQYLQYEKNIIPAYFYSTSCGVTSDVGDVWMNNEESPVYLQGKIQGQEQTDINLSTEKSFWAFISKEMEAYEKEEDWFRWDGTITIESLTAHINENVEDGKIGTITNIEVLERSEGGVLKSIKIIGEKGALTVVGEYQIRKVLCPKDMKLTLQNAESRTVDMLPSGYFAIKVKKKKIELIGGGYGHGVGLSQNGAKAMALLDHGYESILSFYYPETDLLELY